MTRYEAIKFMYLEIIKQYGEDDKSAIEKAENMMFACEDKGTDAQMYLASGDSNYRLMTLKRKSRLLAVSRDDLYDVVLTEHPIFQRPMEGMENIAKAADEKNKCLLLIN